MSDIEKRLAALEAWRARVGPYVNRSIPLGPRELTDDECVERGNKLAEIIKGIVDKVESAAPPVDRSKTTLTEPVVFGDHRDLKANGQQKAYVVLTEDERAKGYVRPVRRSYIHNTCGQKTTMAQSIAETYARDPKFYGGTFCCACGTHFPLDQFVWYDNPDQKVGS